MPCSTNPITRRLNLADLGILVAASAGSLSVLKFILNAERSSQTFIQFSNGYRYYIYAAPFLILGSLAILISRSIDPRPRWSRIARQPGSVACGAILLSFALAVFLLLLKNLIQRVTGRTMDISIWSGREIHVILLSNFYCGQIIIFIWLTLILSRRWHPEPSWVDRAGRMIGITGMLGSTAAFLIP